MVLSLFSAAATAGKVAAGGGGLLQFANLSSHNANVLRMKVLVMHIFDKHPLCVVGRQDQAWCAYTHWASYL